MASLHSISENCCNQAGFIGSIPHMKARFHLCLCFAALLIACDKSRDTGGSPSAGEFQQVTRPAREKIATTRQGLRDSLNTALDIEDLEARNLALADVARNSLKIAPEFSAEAVKQLAPDSAGKLAVLHDCAVTLMAQSPEAALAWADTLGSEKDTAAAKAEIAMVLVATDPERAVKLVWPTDTSDSETKAAAAKVLQRWTIGAPANAASWIATMPAGESRSAGIATVASQWVGANPQAALSWIAALENPAERKVATQACAEILVKQPAPLRSLMAPTDPEARSAFDQQVDQIIREREKENPPADEGEPAAE